MKHTLAIAQRDIAERSFVLLTAAILGVLPFLAILLPSVRAFGKETAVVTIAGFAVGAYTLGLGVILGATTIGRDLSERRLSFYFSRPVSASAIWFGKLAATTFLVLVSLALVFAPSYLYGSAQWGKSWTIQAHLLLAILAGGAMVLYLITHTVGTMIRSKTPLLLLDFVLLLLAVLAGWFVVRPLVFGQAADVIRWLGITAAIVLLAILIAAGAWHLHQGRVDRRANHVSLSRFLWGSIAAMLLLAGAVTAYISSVGPADIAVVHPIDNNGSWTVISGPFRNRGDFNEAFLYNVETGASLRLNCAYCEATISRDGRQALWFRPIEWKSLQRELHVVDLTQRTLRARATGLMLNPGYAAWVVNDEASRLAAIESGVLSVIDIGRNKILAAVRLPGVKRTARSFFLSPNLVRTYAEHQGNVITIYEFDVIRRQLQKTGQFSENAHHQFFTASSDGKELLVRVRGKEAGEPSRYVVRDARTGAVITELPPGNGFGMMLSDGALVLPEKRSGEYVLNVVRGGVTQRSIPLGAYDHASPSSELAAGRILVRASRDASPRQWASLVVDIQRGTVERVGEGLRPAAWWWFANDMRALRQGKQVAFVDQNDALVRWNPLTGEKKVLLGGRKGD